MPGLADDHRAVYSLLEARRSPGAMVHTDTGPPGRTKITAPSGTAAIARRGS